MVRTVRNEERINLYKQCCEIPVLEQEYLHGTVGKTSDVNEEADHTDDIQTLSQNKVTVGLNNIILRFM